jgi:hypothetical protein
LKEYPNIQMRAGKSVSVIFIRREENTKHTEMCGITICVYVITCPQGQLVTQPAIHVQQV